MDLFKAITKDSHKIMAQLFTYLFWLQLWVHHVLETLTTDLG